MTTSIQFPSTDETDTFRATLTLSDTPAEIERDTRRTSKCLVIPQCLLGNTAKRLALTLIIITIIVILETLPVSSSGFIKQVLLAIAAEQTTNATDKPTASSVVGGGG